MASRLSGLKRFEPRLQEMGTRLALHADEITTNLLFRPVSFFQRMIPAGTEFLQGQSSERAAWYSVRFVSGVAEAVESGQLDQRIFEFVNADGTAQRPRWSLHPGQKYPQQRRPFRESQRSGREF